MIGKSPNTAPSNAASAVCPNGIEYTTTATAIEVARAASAAQWARTLKTPRRRKRTSSGSTAKSEVSPSEWFTGSKICLNMVASSLVPATRTLWGGAAALPSCARDRCDVVRPHIITYHTELLPSDQRIRSLLQRAEGPHKGPMHRNAPARL